MNRRLPSLGLAPAGSDFIQPPRYLYSISGQGRPAPWFARSGSGSRTDGRVYVVDFGHRRVSVFTNSGTYLFSFNTTADGKLVNPVHLAVQGQRGLGFRAVLPHHLRLRSRGQVPAQVRSRRTRSSTGRRSRSRSTRSGALRATDVGNTKQAPPRVLLGGRKPDGHGRQDRAGELRRRTSRAPSCSPTAWRSPPTATSYVSDGDNRRVQVFDSNGHVPALRRHERRAAWYRHRRRSSASTSPTPSRTRSTCSTSRAQMLTQFGERGFGPGQFNYPNDIATRQARPHLHHRPREQPGAGVGMAGRAAAADSACRSRRGRGSPRCVPASRSLLLPLILLARRKVRIVVTPDFIDGLEQLGEIKSRRREGTRAPDRAR